MDSVLEEVATVTPPRPPFLVLVDDLPVAVAAPNPLDRLAEREEDLGVAVCGCFGEILAGRGDGGTQAWLIQGAPMFIEAAVRRINTAAGA